MSDQCEKIDLGILKALKTKPTPLEWLGMTAFISIGLFWSILLPPFHTPDEPEHIFRAHMVANSDFCDVKESAEESEIYDNLGYDLPASYKQYFEAVGFNHDTKRQRMAEQRPRPEHPIILRNEQTYCYPFPNTICYSPLSYPIPSIVIKITEWTGGSVTMAVHLCRFAVFLFSCIVIYVVYRLLPFFRQAFVCLLFVPVFIQQCFAPGSDHIILGLGFLYIVLIFRVIHIGATGRRLSIRLQVALLLLLCWVSIAKYPYIGLWAFCLLIPKDRFHGLKHRLVFLAILAVVPVLLIASWLKLWGAVLDSNGIDSLQSVAGADLKLIPQCIRGCINMWYGVKDLWSYWSFHGGLAWFSVWCPSWVSIWHILLLIVTLAAAKLPQAARPSSIFKCLFCLFGTICLIHAAITSGRDLPYQVQGRYYFVLVPVFGYALGLLTERFDWKSKCSSKLNGTIFHTVIAITIVISLGSATYGLILRFGLPW